MESFQLAETSARIQVVSSSPPPSLPPRYLEDIVKDLEVKVKDLEEEVISINRHNVNIEYYH